MLSNDEYTKYEGGIGNNNNIFVTLNKIPFKGYETIEGLNTSHFWSNKKNSKKIKEKVENKIKELMSKERLTGEEQIKLEKLQKAERAIDCFEFNNNIDKRVDCYIEMLTDNEYTGYEKDNRFIPLSSACLLTRSITSFIVL